MCYLQVSEPILAKTFYRKVQSKKVFSHRESFDAIIVKTEEKLAQVIWWLIFFLICQYANWFHLGLGQFILLFGCEKFRDSFIICLNLRTALLDDSNHNPFSNHLCHTFAMNGIIVYKMKFTVKTIFLSEALKTKTS